MALGFDAPDYGGLQLAVHRATIKSQSAVSEVEQVDVSTHIDCDGRLRCNEVSSIPTTTTTYKPERVPRGTRFPYLDSSELQGLAISYSSTSDSAAGGGVMAIRPCPRLGPGEEW